LIAWLGIGALSGEARAGDSPAECAAAEDAWRNRPTRFTEADAYAGMGDAIAAPMFMAAAAMVPTVGVQLERGRDLPAATLSWSASLPFGPITACRTARFSNDLFEFQSLRAVLEGGVVIRSPAWPYLRPGLRAIWHRSNWRMGVGAGVGSTVALMPGQHGAASISPELVLHYGNCCGYGYGLFTLRADVFTPRRYPTTASANLGFAFW